MATSASFKQECPSCEALIPIRDANLVGKKIDCPKCKYRFEVAAPASAAKDDEATTSRPRAASRPTARLPDRQGGHQKRRPAAKNGKPGPGKRKDEDDDEDTPKPKKKKKSGSSMTLILGLGAGLVAVAGLVLAAVFFFAFGRDSTKSGSGVKTGAAAQADKGGGLYR